MRAKAIFVLTVLVAGPAAAGDARVSQTVDLLAAPRLAAKVVRSIPADSGVSLFDCTLRDGSRWCRVRYLDRTGFVLAGALGPFNEVVAASVVAVHDLAPVRTAPNGGAELVGFIPKQTPVQVLNCVPGLLGGWCLVSTPHMSGYVRQRLINRYDTVIFEGLN